MRRLFAAIVTLIAMNLVGCGGTKPDAGRPDWVDGASARYPAEQYLLGRGAAAELDSAKDRARADLAKTFQVTVSEESHDVQSITQQSDKTGTQQQGKLQISRAIDTRTDALIRGIEIADIWRDPATRHYHVLAVLARAQAARGLRQDIQDLDAATVRYLRESRAQSDPMKQIAAAAQAVAAQRERADAQRMLRVIDASGQGVAPKWNLRELENDLGILLTRVKIAPRLGGNDATGVDAALRGALADSGFSSAVEGEDYDLETTLTLEALGQREGWYWYTGKLELVLRDRAGQVRGSRQWSIKESATQESVAKQRARDSAGAILKKELRSTLLGFAGE